MTRLRDIWARGHYAAVVFFFVGCMYGFNTFYTAATVYLEAGARPQLSST